MLAILMFLACPDGPTLAPECMWCEEAEKNVLSEANPWAWISHDSIQLWLTVVSTADPSPCDGSLHFDWLWIHQLVA